VPADTAIARILLGETPIRPTTVMGAAWTGAPLRAVRGGGDRLHDVDDVRGG